MREVAPKPGFLQGQEREIAILFADLCAAYRADLFGLAADLPEPADYAAAIDRFRACLALEPDSATYYCGLGSAFLRAGRLDEGERGHGSKLEPAPGECGRGATTRKLVCFCVLGAGRGAMQSGVQQHW